jgi:hypothetical protein
VIDVARDGALVVGASSMGALRAAECWPVGVQGIGLVYRAFRMGILDSDGEVAVGSDQDNQFRAISVALVNVRYAVARAVRRRRLTAEEGRRVVDAAMRVFYPERQWRALLREAGVRDDSGDLVRFLMEEDIKRKDAVLALEHVARLVRSGELAARHARTNAESFVRLNRQTFYPYLGSSPDVLRGELVAWLFGTGRYQKYLWPLLAGRAQFQGMPESERSERLREALCDVLSEILPHDDALAKLIWEELAFVGELYSEIARMYAARRLAEEAMRSSIAIDPQVLERVRKEVSIAHGTYHWDLLQENVIEGRLCGAIPFDWILRSCETLARARSYVRHVSRPRG